MMKLRLAFPEMLIDIHELDADLRYIREENGALEIGASPVTRTCWTLRLLPSATRSCTTRRP